MQGSVARSNAGVPKGEKCGVACVGPIVSVQEVMGAELSRPRPVYEGGVGLRLEDVEVSNAGGCGHVVSEQDRAFPSRCEHAYSTRRNLSSVLNWCVAAWRYLLSVLSRCVASWRYLSSVSDTDRVAATRALQRVANELLLFLQAHKCQFD